MCAAVGSPISASTPSLRCPACGQPLPDPLPASCPLCAFQLVDHRITGEDITPYAEARERDEGGWWKMARWVIFSNAGRMKHLALMRDSTASRRFVRFSALWLGLSLGLCEWSRTGWHWVIAASGKLDPTGAGWFRVAAVPRPLPPTQMPDAPIDLWWNPAQMLIAVPVAMLLGWLIAWLLLRVLRGLLAMAHGRGKPGEQRMGAALHYGSAWMLLIVPAGLACALRPLGYVGPLNGWTWAPSADGMLILAGGLAGFALTMWWLWLIRLGASAPAAARGKVLSVLTLGVPLLTAAALLGWWHAVPAVCKPLFNAMKLGFST